MTILVTPTNTQWRKSTYTAQGGADCVEVANLPSAIARRYIDSTDGAISGGPGAGAMYQ
ncbi:hypothetical protein GCM10029978_082150 [Actinoallomurus acanthiterrae]